MAQAVLYVELVPTSSGIKRNIEKELNGTFDTAEKKGTSVFSKIGSLAKGAALVAAGVAATLAGIALKGGFERMLKIEDAEAKLTGLGHSAQSVETIMDSALNAVLGTSYGLEEAATVAATAVAAGIAPGKQLEKYLRLTADAATIAGGSLDEMGSILNKVTASGRVSGEEINQLQERGIPILQYLADQYGVTADEMSKMVSRGEVDAAAFRQALEDNLGGAALSAGDTTQGAFANMMIALDRLGIALIGGIFPYVQPALSAISGFIDGITERIGPLGENLGAKFELVAARIYLALSPIWEVVGPIIDRIGQAAMPVLAALGEAFGTLWAAIEPLLPQLLDMFTQFSPLLLILETLGPVIGELAGVLAGVLGGAITALLPFVIEFVGMLGGLLASVLPMLIPLITLLGEILGTVFAAVLPIVVALLEPVMSIFQALAPVVLAIVAAVLPLVSVLLEALAPILQIVAAIIAAILVPTIQILAGIIQVLAGIIVWLVENIVIPYIQDRIVPIWEALGAAFKWVYENIIKPVFDFFAEKVTTTVDGAVKAFGILGGFFSGLWSGIQSGFKGFINFIIDGINNFIRGLNAVGSFISDITGGAVDIRIGTLPRLANGALVEAIPGGSAAILGEGRYDEAVMPLGGPQLEKIRDAFGQDNPPAGPVDLSDTTIEKLARTLSGYVRVQSRQGVSVNG